MIGAASAIFSVLAFVDSRLRFLIWAALPLSGLALARDRRRVFLPLLTLMVAVPFFAGFSTGADSANYYVYTSSLLVDRDLDLTNQWAGLGLAVPPRTEAGLPANPMSVGPGLLWSPAVALTHAWLRSTGGAADPLRLSIPYYAAAAALTLAVLLFALLELVGALSGWFGVAEARIAVLTVALASPLLYYAFEQPLMSHALTFAFAALCLAFTLRAQEERTLASWARCGACLGLAMLCRAQSAALFLLPAAGLWRARAGWKAALSAGGAAFALFLPQMAVWAVMYGSFITIPQGHGFIDWSGRHALDVLISADRGLFNWHPAQLLGLVGLVLALKDRTEHALAALVVFAFTAYLNGSVRDWNASSAFGARRFDVVLPLLALGIAAFLARVRPVLERRPFLLPALGLGLAFAWNVSLIQGLRGRPAGALPLDDLVQLQAGQARRAVDATFGRLGPRARDVIYRAFVGLFTYENYRPGGDFNPAELEPRFLKRGWSDPQVWDDGVRFRYLLFPEGCVIIPLDEPFDIRGFVSARSPARIKDQRVTLFLNGRRMVEAELPPAWTEIHFDAPGPFWLRGENELCVRAAKRRPGDEGDDLAFAAAVARIQLP